MSKHLGTSGHWGILIGLVVIKCWLSSQTTYRLFLLPFPVSARKVSCCLCSLLMWMCLSLPPGTHYLALCGLAVHQRPCAGTRRNRGINRNSHIFIRCWSSWGVLLRVCSAGSVAQSATP